jgi:hypothetical protein
MKTYRIDYCYTFCDEDDGRIITSKGYCLIKAKSQEQAIKTFNKKYRGDLVEIQEV